MRAVLFKPGAVDIDDLILLVGLVLVSYDDFFLSDFLHNSDFPVWVFEDIYKVVDLEFSPVSRSFGLLVSGPGPVDFDFDHEDGSVADVDVHEFGV